MKFQQIRSATVKIEFGGKRFLVDPMLSEKGSFPAFPHTPNDHLLNPIVDLTLPLDEIIDVDCVLVTHTHLDHWDDAAKAAIPKDMPIIVQHAADAVEVKSAGFTNVSILEDTLTLDGITLTKTSGQHGSDQVMEAIGDLLGEVCGIVFTHPAEKSLYLAGDTVWNDHVAGALRTYQPDVVILNAGDAQVLGLGSIIMNKEDVASVYNAAPDATIIASHMESVNHAMLSRTDLRAFLSASGMTDRVLVPDDAECYSF
jgi:L-ascorbate metabolism protein UlaG (beta-lactamase superfamily)